MLQHLKEISLDAPQRKGGLSALTILHARGGERVHPRQLQRLRITALGF